MFHLTNRMFKEQKLPDVENVLKSNPELMKQFQQAAAKEYILPQNNKKEINNFSGNMNQNNGGAGILGMVSGLFNNIGSGSMRNNLNKNNRASRDDDSDSISEIDSIIDSVHKNITVKISTTTRDLGFLNKFRNGVSITKINPIKLLIKNRG